MAVRHNDVRQGMIWMPTEVVTTENAWIVAIFGIGSIMGLTGYALSRGINGVVFATGVGTIYLIVGLCFGIKYQKAKQAAERFIDIDQEEDEQEGEA